MSKAPLRSLRNSDFFSLYQVLLKRGKLNTAQAETLLTAAVIFLNHDNSDIVALGYRIVVMYANLTRDFLPLYDVAIGRGYMPIVASAQSELSEGEDNVHFFPEYFSSVHPQYLY